MLSRRTSIEGDMIPIKTECRQLAEVQGMGYMCSDDVMQVYMWLRSHHWHIAMLPVLIFIITLLGQSISLLDPGFEMLTDPKPSNLDIRHDSLACTSGWLFAHFNLVSDDAAHTMSEYVIYDYVKFSDSGCSSDSDTYEAYLTYMHKT